MGPRIPLRRKPGRKSGDEPPIPAPSDTTTAGAERTDTGTPVTPRRESRHRKGPQPGVTHRSPSPDDMLLPCCGRATSDVRAQDRITTDPAEVTCPG